MSDWNDRVIAEFRANDGVVGGAFEGSRLLLITTIGARTGETRVSPVAFTDEGDTRILIASKAGAASHPGWFHNILANPNVHVEASTAAGIEEYDAIASLFPEEWREQRYRQIVASRPAFAKYWTNEQKTIPLVVLTRVAHDKQA